MENFSEGAHWQKKGDRLLPASYRSYNNCAPKKFRQITEN